MILGRFRDGVAREKVYTVYCHINRENGKKYIGITSQPLSHRWANGKGYKGCPAFYGAIAKYGWDGFDHEVIFEGLTFEEACEAERRLIAEQGTRVPNGYNCEGGGRQYKTISEDTRRKQSEAHRGEKNTNYGKAVSQEVRDKIAKTLHETHTGWHHSEETKRKMSRSATGRPCSQSVRDAISKANKGRHPTEARRRLYAKRILQLDNDGNVIAEYYGTREVQRNTGINRCCVSDCLHGRQLTAGGYKWVFAEY